MCIGEGHCRFGALLLGSPESGGNGLGSHYPLPTLAHRPSPGTCHTLAGRRLTHPSPVPSKSRPTAPWRRLDFLSGERLPPAGGAAAQSPSPSGALAIKNLSQAHRKVSRISLGPGVWPTPHSEAVAPKPSGRLAPLGAQQNIPSSSRACPPTPAPCGPGPQQRPSNQLSLHAGFARTCTTKYAAGNTAGTLN